MQKASETIFSGKEVVIPMVEVSHIERDTRPGFMNAIRVIMKHSIWQDDVQHWSPSIWMPSGEAQEFLKAWCFFRGEVDPVAHAEGSTG